jgi:hypothetical protein
MSRHRRLDVRYDRGFTPPAIGSLPVEVEATRAAIAEPSRPGGATTGAWFACHGLKGHLGTAGPHRPDVAVIVPPDPDWFQYVRVA